MPTKLRKGIPIQHRVKKKLREIQDPVKQKKISAAGGVVFRYTSSEVDSLNLNRNYPSSPHRDAVVSETKQSTEQCLEVLLIQRSGLWDIPKGKVEKNETATEAAIREAEEEIGILSNEIEVCGYLDTYETGTGFRILPVVAFVKEKFTKKINKLEVDELFEVPLEFILDSDNHVLKSGFWNGAVRHYYTINYFDYNIWGATAGMLVNLFDRIKSNA